MKKKIVILTLNDYVIYQPSILNLYDFLSTDFDVTVLSFQPKFVTKKKDEKRNIIYLKSSFIESQLYQKFDFIFSKFIPVIKKINNSFNFYHIYYNIYLPKVLKRYLIKNHVNPDIVIAVDLQALYVAQKLYGPVHFLSLEIDNKTNKYYQKIDNKKIKSVFVQSQMRCEYLFPDQKIKKFIIQNAPVYKSDPQKYDRKNFIWAGTIDHRFAIVECIHFFDKHQEYKLVMKGGGNPKTINLINKKYKHLLEKNVIVYNQEYLPSNSFIDFLSKFNIGFCFYDWDLINSSFNYLTAPSGKIFMYFAAGTPVIACDIPGFNFVKEFGAGVLIKDYKPETILKAIQIIEADYEKYSEASLELAKHYSFDKNVEPYIKFLLEEG